MILLRIITPPTCVILWGSTSPPKVFKAFWNTGKAKEKSQLLPWLFRLFTSNIPSQVLLPQSLSSFLRLCTITTRNSEYQATTGMDIFCQPECTPSFCQTKRTPLLFCLCIYFDKYQTKIFIKNQRLSENPGLKKLTLLLS